MSKHLKHPSITLCRHFHELFLRQIQILLGDSTPNFISIWELTSRVGRNLLQARCCMMLHLKLSTNTCVFESQIISFKTSSKKIMYILLKLVSKIIEICIKARNFAQNKLKTYQIDVFLMHLCFDGALKFIMKS